MQVIREQAALSHLISDLKGRQKSIGFVPTMGALHDGHLDLVKRSAMENDVTVISIFVNPTQFNNPEDLKKYPRNIDKDLEMVQKLAQVAFVPSVDVVYPDGAVSKHYDLGDLETTMEGEFRPGHFQGVATVVHRFFDLVRPDKAYFGEKDFQQLLVIRKLRSLMNIPTEIIGHPIVRAKNGLALSSRNARLEPKQLQEAVEIYDTMQWCRENWRNHSPGELKKKALDRLEAGSLQPEYVEICDGNDLKIIENWEGSDSARICVAAYSANVRLIDNLSLF